MHFNKLSALLLAMGISSVGVAQAETVTFSGSITSGACSIAPDSTDINVPMGSITANSVKNGAMASPVRFNINLKDCEAAKTVKVTFTGTPDTVDNDLLALQGGGARGAGIALLNDNGAQIALGDESVGIPVLIGDNSLRLQAALKGNSSTSTAVPGVFTSVANFTLNYY